MLLRKYRPLFMQKIRGLGQLGGLMRVNVSSWKGHTFQTPRGCLMTQASVPRLENSGSMSWKVALSPSCSWLAERLQT